MEYLIEEDDEAYKRQFSTYIADGIEPDAMEDIYKSAHEAIRADPSHSKKVRVPMSRDDKLKVMKFRNQRTNYKQRANRVQQKIKAFKRGQAAEEEDDE